MTRRQTPSNVPTTPPGYADADALEFERLVRELGEDAARRLATRRLAEQLGITKKENGK